ncbi:MAG: hypothetical protein N2039_14965 [Gemmataceae bacterium]|nr:hypothetical protein [Gemmataceae bacterium]
MRIIGVSIWAVIVTKLVAATPEFDRRIGKEPKYQGQPSYCLLVFDAEAKQRVWLVHDGESLYVDRNGNGDLTEAGEKVAARVARAKTNEEPEGYLFEVGTLKVGKLPPKSLTVTAIRLKRFEDGPPGELPAVRAALQRDRMALGYMVRVEAERPGIKGGGDGGRVDFVSGPTDLNGVLQFAPTPSEAPVLHYAGPLDLNFYTIKPELQVGRGVEFVLVVGARGSGPGTLAMIAYEGTVPKELHPVAEITFPAKEGEKPITERVELKDRC